MVDDAFASTEPAESGGNPMAHVQPSAPAGVGLARARVLGALFGEDRAEGAFGRLRVLDRLGAGGMGVVYEAYDPDLARGVALKLINVIAKNRETALAEAKALARLSHPNVVPIYDVGVERDHVYLVMELVRGETLGAWSRGRTFREILAVYHQAGLALAAAHAAGLVHRDFKPDNAIVGTDGRVRVVDFGLACEADGPGEANVVPRGAAGTPRFMAPEIRAGTAVTPAADQYSFSVAFAEALARVRGPAPRRIGALLARGRAVQAADRFATMTELLRELSRDPARTRRRAIVVGAMSVSMVSMAFAVGRQTPSKGASCDAGGAQLETVWSRTARGTALQRLAAFGSYGATLQSQLARELDAYAARWQGQHRAACLARRGGAESDTLADRRTACLKQGSDALATVGELITRAEPEGLAELPRAVQSLPDPVACSDVVALSSEIAPPRPDVAARMAEVQQRITQARIQLGAGRHELARAAAVSAVAAARAVDYGPVLADALVVQGHAEILTDHAAVAVPILAEATTVALAARADALVVEAWARRAWAQGTSLEPDGALAGVDLIAVLAQRTNTAGFARALFYNNLGSIELARSRMPAARMYLERALVASRGVTGAGALELVAIRTNLALAVERRSDGDRLLAQASAELTEQLGADHPDTLEVRRRRVYATVENLRHAVELLVPVCRGHELHASLANLAAGCWTEVGLLAWDLGEHAQASDAMRHATELPGQHAEAAGYLALWDRCADAQQRFAAAAAALPPAQPRDPLWSRLPRAELALGRGRACLAIDELRCARSALEEAIVVLAPVVEGHPAVRYERQLGRAQAALALTLAKLGDRSAARAMATGPAVSRLRDAGAAFPEALNLLRAQGSPR